MPEPYRTAVRPDPLDDEQLRSCEFCRRTFVPLTADVDVCAPCLRKACRAVERAAGSRRPAARDDRLVRYIAPALAVGLFSFLTFAVTSTMHYMAEARIAATQALLASQVAQAKEKPAKKRKPDAPREVEPAAPPLAHDPLPMPELPAVPSLLLPLRPESHDPDMLITRVKKLREAGFEIFLVRTELGRSPLEESFSDMHSRVTPVLQKGKSVGMRLTRVGQDSLAALAGLQNGDVVVSINGHGLDSPDEALSGYESARGSDAAVFELLRNGRRVVLDVRWKDARTAR